MDAKINENQDFYIDYFDGTGFISSGLHRHSCSELLFVTRGKLNFLSGDEIYHSGGASLIFFREKKMHTTEVDPECEYQRYLIKYKYRMVSDFLNYDDVRNVLEPDCTIVSLDENSIAELFGYFKPLISLQDNDGRSENMRKNLLSLILTKASLLYSLQSGKNDFVMRSYISDVVKYISANLDVKLVISDIAAEFYVSRAKLINDFKAATGITIGDFIMTKRLRKACECLKSGMSVTETAMKCGYMNPCHFIRTFKKNTGTTPLQYSRSHSS